MSKAFRNTEKLNLYERHGIRWVKREYNNFSCYARAQSLAVEFAENIFQITNKSKSYSIIKKLLNVRQEHQGKIDVAWKYYFNRVITPFAEQYAAAEYLLANQRFKKVRIIAFHSFASFLRKDLASELSVTIFPGLLFYTIFNMAYSSLIGMLQRKFSSSRKMGEIQSINPNLGVYEKCDINPDIYSVVYFPHQGVYYGEMFMKDHFYNARPDSPFYKSKILHVSLGEKDASYMSGSYKYYKENSISYTDLNDIAYDKKVLHKSLIMFLKNMNFTLLKEMFVYGIWYLLLSVFIFKRIRRCCMIFSQFKNLKVALVGYEFLFPKYLAAALTMLDIKICATEERFIMAFFPDNYLIMDYYFVAGDIIREPCLKTSKVNNFLPVGLVRVDNLYKYEKKHIYDEKYDSIKKTKKLVMALDFYLPANDIDDTLRPAAKAYETIQFYKCLIKLANEFPSLYIVIKGKEADSYKSRYIIDLVEVINGTENMEIELDYARYNPYFIGEKVDLTIACHTSLCDELLAAGRKVIIYEITDRLDTLFNYNKLPIIADSYEILKYHVQNFINGVYLDKDTIEKIKKEFYSDCYHGNVAKNIRLELEKIIAG
ncbi:MAG: hypothetical protein PHC68_00135 [Syntrophorhabdaceae bacterium]|nr:hypothetical protein [Syntrophorhabdaceae bacterium]